MKQAQAKDVKLALEYIRVDPIFKQNLNLKSNQKIQWNLIES